MALGQCDRQQTPTVFGVLMTVHLCRDLVVGSTGSYSNMYALACFLQGVLGFTKVGASGRSEWINTLLPIALQSGGSSGGDTLSSVGGVGVLTLTGSVGTWPVGIPNGATDHILAIKSNTYPLVNSGLYRIVGATTHTITYDTRTFDSGSVPFADGNFTWTVFPPVESIFNDLDIPINNDSDGDHDVDTNGWDNNPQYYHHVNSGDPLVQSHPRVDSPQTGDTGPPNHFPVYGFTDDSSANPSVDNNGRDTVDDYYSFQSNKAFQFYIWSPNESLGGVVGRSPSRLEPNSPTYSPEYIASATPVKTLVASLIDSPANLWGAADDGTYHTQGSAYMLRAIYQSPHSTGWQIRLAMESAYDTGDANAGGALNGVTLSLAPGFSGSNGDFATGPNGGRHLHGALWYNTASSSYRGLTVGLNPNQSSHIAAVGTLGTDYANQTLYTFTSFNAGHIFSPATHTNDFRWRMFIWGDDVTGTVVVCNRGYFNASDEFAAFGLPEDETLPLQPDPINRLFAVGQTGYGQGVDWRTGTWQDDGIGGVAYSLDKRKGPITCAMATYNFVSIQQNYGNSIRYDGAAGDTPFLGASEVIPVDLIAGGRDSAEQNRGVEVLPFEIRRMGRFPIARFGRSTGQPTWSTVDSANLWFHTTNGFYLPWGGVRPMS